MAVEQAKVMDGINTYLSIDSTFNTALGGSATVRGRFYYDTAPRIGETTSTGKMQYPYVVFFLISGVYNDTFAKDGYNYRVQFSIFEDKEAGPRACMDITDALRARLHRQGFAVTGHDNMTAREDVPTGPTLIDGAWMQTTDYFIQGYED